MKKYGIMFVTAMFFASVFGGCMQSPIEEPVDDELVEIEQEFVEEFEEELTEEVAEDENLGDMVENMDNYGAADITTFGLTPCPDYPEAEEFIDEAEAEGIKQFALFEAESTSLVLYVTPNLRGVDTDTFYETVSQCIDGAGMIGALKAFDDNLLWGYPYCTAGLAPDPELQPELYEEYVECMKVQDELMEYLEIS